MMYDRVWYIFKEELMQMHGGGAMNIEDLLCMMNRIEIEENKNNNKKLLDFGMRMHPNT